MPYPETCPECGGAFRNTGSHYTARRNEVGRHVLLELGCQATSGRFWWDFTTGELTADGRAARGKSREALVTTVTAGAVTIGALAKSSNGHTLATTLEAPSADARDLPNPSSVDAPDLAIASSADVPDLPNTSPVAVPDLPSPRSADVSDLPSQPSADMPDLFSPTPIEMPDLLSSIATRVSDTSSPAPLAPPGFVDLASPPALKEAFVRQLQLDRLTLRQMRSWLMADDARRAIEVAAGATEATYERLALILFGTDLQQLLGKEAPPPAPPSMSAEERLELQREKARIRARLRRAAIKAARQDPS
jgi:hypothetical protein